MSGAANPHFECRQALATLWSEVRVSKVFGLKPQGCDWRAKFMGRIGNEPTLLLKHGRDAIEQPINRLDKGTQFVWHPVNR